MLGKNRKKYKLTAIVAIAAVLGVASIPTTLSTQNGKDWIAGKVNARIPGSVSLQSVRFSWFGRQKLDGLMLKDPEGKEVLSVSEISIKKPFISLLWNTNDFPHIQVKGLNAEILPQEKSINLYRALGIKHADINHDHSPITLKNFNIKLAVPYENGNYRSSVTGKTDYLGKLGAFNVDTIQYNPDPLSVFTHESGKFSIELDHFPTVLLDIVASLKKKKASTEYHTLLGNILNLTFIHQKDRSEETIQLSSSSPVMQANFSGKIEDDIVRMDHQSRLTWNLSSEAANNLVDHILKKARVRFKRSVKATVTLDALQAPVTFFYGDRDKVNSTGIALQGLISISESELMNAKGQGRVLLDGISVAINAPENSASVQLDFEAKAKQNQHPVSIKMSGSMDKPSHIDLIFENLKREAKLKLETIGFGHLIGLITNEPLVDHGRGILEIGVSKGVVSGDFEYHSDILDIHSTDIQGIIRDNTLSLSRPLTSKFRSSPTLINPFLGTNQIVVISDLEGELKLDQFETGRFFFVQSALHLNPYKAHVQSFNETIQVSNTEALIRMKGGSEGIGYNLNFVLEPIEEGAFQDLFGHKAKAAISGSVKDFTDVQFQLASDVSNISGAGRIQRKEGFSLTDPIRVSVRLTQKVLTKLFPGRKRPIPMQGASTVLLTIDQPEDPVHLNNLSQSSLSGKLTIPEISFAGTRRMQSATFKRVSIPWSLSGPSNQIRCEFNANTFLKGSNQHGTVEGMCLLTDWLDLNKPKPAHALIEGKLFADHMPVTLLKVIADDESLAHLMGDTIDINLTTRMRLKPEVDGTADLSLTGDDFSLSAALNLDANTFTLRDDRYHAWFKMKMTPERFETLRELIRPAKAVRANIQLTENAEVEGKIRRLKVPRRLDDSFPLWSSEADLEVNTTNLNIIDNDRNETFEFPHIEMILRTKNIGKKVDFSVHAEETVSRGGAGKIELKGVIENALTDEGKFNNKTITLNVDGTARQLPVGLFSRLIRFSPNMDNKIEAVLGSMLNADVKVQVQKMSGPVYAAISGKTGRVHLDGRVEQGALKLNKTFEAQLTATPELGKYVFKDVLPIFSSITTADTPLTLRIDPKGFSFPLRTMELSEMQIGGATLNLGKMQFRNEGPISSLLTILNDPNNPQLSLWCTPCYFKVENGVIGIARMDVLVADHYPIAVWGKVNLPANKIHLLIGLSGPALAKAFNMSGLKNNVMITLPLKGTIGKASINKTKAVTKLASLAVKKGGDAKGVLFGTMLDIATGNIMDPSVPPPTTQPLPWESLVTEVKPQSKPKKSTPAADAVKGVKQEAQNLIKKIFN